VLSVKKDTIGILLAVFVVVSCLSLGEMLYLVPPALRNSPSAMSVNSGASGNGALICRESIIFPALE